MACEKVAMQQAAMKEARMKGGKCARRNVCMHTCPRMD
jgi:hypothetical protein